MQSEADFDHYGVDGSKPAKRAEDRSPRRNRLLRNESGIGFCNKGTASAGPQPSQNEVGLHPLLLRHVECERLLPSFVTDWQAWWKRRLQDAKPPKGAKESGSEPQTPSPNSKDAPR